MVNQQIKTRAWTRTKLTLLVTGVKRVKSVAWVKLAEEKRLQERRGRPKEIGFDQSVDQDAERRRRVVESSVQAEKLKNLRPSLSSSRVPIRISLTWVGFSLRETRSLPWLLLLSSFFATERDRGQDDVLEETISSPAYTCLKKIVSCLAKISDVSCVY